MYDIARAIMSGQPINNYHNSELAEFAKAVSGVSKTAYGTDAGGRTGDVTPYQPESLSTTVRKVHEKTEDIKLISMLKTEKADQVTHIYTVKDNIGGQPGAVFNGELEVIPLSQSNGKRVSVNLKFAMVRRAIGAIVNKTKSIQIEKKSENSQDMLKEILRGYNTAAYVGNESVAPWMPNSIRQQLVNVGLTAKNIVNANMSSDYNSIVKDIVLQKAAQVAGRGSFGRTTHLLASFAAQTQLDNTLYSQFRVIDNNNTNSSMLGTPVRGIKTSFGDIQMVNDVFIPDASTTAPASTQGGVIPSHAPGVGSMTATPVSAATVTAATQTSYFTAARAGAIYFAAAPIGDSFIEGTVSPVVTATVVTGGAVDIVMTPNGDGKTSGWALYASIVAPGAVQVASQLRLVAYIPCTDPNNRATATTYRWLCEKIPGTTSLYALDLRKEALAFVKLGDAFSMDNLAFSDVAAHIQANIMVGMVTAMIPQRQIVIENVQADTTWKFAAS